MKITDTQNIQTNKGTGENETHVFYFTEKASENDWENM